MFKNMSVLLTLLLTPQPRILGLGGVLWYPTRKIMTSKLPPYHVIIDMIHRLFCPTKKTFRQIRFVAYDYFC